MERTGPNVVENVKIKNINASGLNDMENVEAKNIIVCYERTSQKKEEVNLR